MNMVERVARAMARRQIVSVLNQGIDGIAGHPPEAQVAAAMRAEGYLYPQFMDDARAAIEAMREPTAEMTDSGTSVSDWAAVEDGDDDDYRKNVVYHTYTAMIDEALK